MKILSELPKLLDGGEWAQAEKILRTAAGQRGAGAHVFYNLAKVLEAQDKEEDTLPWLRKAVAADPKHALAWYELGRCKMSRNLSEAEFAFRTAARLLPGDPDCWRNLARVRFRLEDWQGCAAALQELPEDDETLSMAYRVTCELHNASTERFETRPQSAARKM